MLLRPSLHRLRPITIRFYATASKPKSPSSTKITTKSKIKMSAKKRSRSPSPTLSTSVAIKDDADSRRQVQKLRLSSPSASAPPSQSFPTSPSQTETWPAPMAEITSIREFIHRVVQSPSPVLLVPDKDADGLNSGTIMRRTLISLGKPKEKIAVHHITKGGNVHQRTERAIMESIEIEGEKCEWVIVLDQGSRGGVGIVEGEVEVRDERTGEKKMAKRKVAIIDHHYSLQFPEGAIVCSAANAPPIATTSLLTYIICTPLLADKFASENGAALESTLTSLALTGHMGDMGTTFNFNDPIYPPLLHTTQKALGKSALSKLVSLLNAPRRSPTADPSPSWDLLQLDPPPEPKTLISLLDSPPKKDDSPTIASARSLLQILDNYRTTATAQVESISTPPVFTADGRLAVLTISSPWQIHPVVATRWAGFLKSKKLVAVGCANTGFLEGRVNLSCRLAKRSMNMPSHVSKSASTAKMKTEKVEHLDSDKELDTDAELEDDSSTNIITLLKAYAATDPEFSQRLREEEENEDGNGGVSFARGHREAAGGSLTTELWEMFSTRCLKLGIKSDEPDGGTSPRKKKGLPAQKNTLDGYFGGGAKKKTATLAK